MKCLMMDRIKICSVGRLSDAKGFDMAILACKKLSRIWL